jgi:hypothetical protein
MFIPFAALLQFVGARLPHSGAQRPLTVTPKGGFIRVYLSQVTPRTNGVSASVFRLRSDRVAYGAIIYRGLM